MLLFLINNRDNFVNINNKLIVKNINGDNKQFINLTDYNNIDIGKLFNGSIKLKISIPENFKAIITYRYDDMNRLFAFNLELPDGDHILERYIRKTKIDKIIITNIFGDVATSLILAKNENGGVIYTANKDRMINWEAIGFAPNKTKTIYGSNAMLPIYYNPRNNPINVRRIPHSYILSVSQPATQPVVNRQGARKVR
jgi:hypothetical protein